MWLENVVNKSSFVKRIKKQQQQDNESSFAEKKTGIISAYLAKRREKYEFVEKIDK